MLPHQRIHRGMLFENLEGWTFFHLAPRCIILNPNHGHLTIAVLPGATCLSDSDKARARHFAANYSLIFEQPRDALDATLMQRNNGGSSFEARSKRALSMWK